MGNPFVVALTTAAVGMNSTPTVEVIRTRFITKNREGVFRRKTLTLEYGGFRKAYYT